MLYVKQKEYVKDRYYSFETIQHVLFSFVQGLSLFFIVFGFLGGLWTKLDLEIPEDIQYFEGGVVCYSKQLMEEISSGCKIILEFQDLRLWISLFCCILTIFLYRLSTNKKKNIFVAVSVAMLVIISLAHREEIFRGARYIVESFLKLYNIYFGTKLTCGKISYLDVIWVGEALLCISAILVLLCGVDIFLFQSVKVSIILVALQCILIFIVGQVPDTTYTCLMVLGVVLVWFLGKNKEPLSVCREKGRIVFEQSYNEKIGIQNSVYIVMLAFFIFFFVTKTVLMPSFIWFENHRELSTIISDIGNLKPEELVSKIQDVMDSIKKEKPGEAGMGMSGGNLGGAESVKGNGEIDLIVTVDGNYSGYVYLKGYAASSYTGDSWEQLPSWLSTDEEILSSTTKLRTMLKNIFGENVATINVVVERIKADAKYSYIPYFSDIELSEKQYYLNGWIKGDGNAVKQYTAYPLISPNKILELLERVTTPWKSGDLSYSAIKDISSECMKYPKELESIKEDFITYINGQTPMLDGNQKENGSMMNYNQDIDFTDLTGFVKSYLAQKATYSLSPGVTPKKRDFVEYFLTEQKKGYCVHFATSAAMLYRMFGYPTRYVEGYLVKINSNKPTYVKNNTAHAWVEVYLEGLGWIPIEVTPGYTSQNIPNNNGDEIIERPTNETPDETINKNPDASGDGTGNNSGNTGTKEDDWNGSIIDGPFDSNNGGNGFINIGKPNQSGGALNIQINWSKMLLWILKKIMPFILAIAFIWLAILIRSHILLCERRRRISNGNSRQIILSLYEFTCRLAIKKGISMDVEGDAEEMQRKLASHKIEEIEQWKAIVQKAYFYPEPVPKEERQVVMDIYSSVYDIIRAEKFGSKLLKFVYCYPEPTRKKTRVKNK